MSLLFLPVIPSPLLQSYAPLRGQEIESTAFANSVFSCMNTLEFCFGTVGSCGGSALTFTRF